MLMVKEPAAGASGDAEHVVSDPIGRVLVGADIDVLTMPAGRARRSRAAS